MTVAAVANAVVSSHSTHAHDRTLARIVGSRADAAERIHDQIEAGLAIRDLRIRYPEDLDDARARKQEWVQKTTELLMTVFDNGSVADYCNDWVGKIFPEYAEFGNFVEQFYEEMTHRLSRLKAVYKRVEQGLETHAHSKAAAPAPVEQAPDAQDEADELAPAGASAEAGHVPTTLASGASGVVAVPAAAPSSHRHSAPVASPSPGSMAATVLLALPADAKEISEPLVQFMIDLGIHTQRLGDSASGGDWTEAIEPQAAFALIAPALLTHQDQSHAAFRLGYCAGKLGRNRVCVVHTGSGPSGLEPLGLPHLTLDKSGGWQLQLARQLKRAGIAVDLNKLC